MNLIRRFRSILLMRFFLVTLSVFWFGALAVRATPYYVETNGSDATARTGLDWANAFLTIGNGVVHATSGDTVIVSNGTYTLNSGISVGSKNPFTIRSLNGRDQTFINGNYPNTTNACFFFYNCTSVLSGFTISNGCARGGGVYMQADCAVTLTNCVIAGNRTDPADKGGGIHCAGINNLIVDCVVTGNSNAQYGAGVYLSGGSIRDCRIISNSAAGWYGGGIFGENGCVISNCEIKENSGSAGSGLYLQGSAVADSCVIVSNQTGGSVSFWYNGFLRNSVISYNTSGGVLCDNGGVVQNCLITRNSGDALKLNSVQSAGYVANCTIVSNLNNAIVLAGATTDTVFNCIIASNNTDVYLDTGGTTNAFRYSCIPGGGSTLPPGRGNITTDPVFIDAIPGSANNWRLSQNSPCINAGTNQSWMTNSYDLDGRMRIRYGTVDMGAYETIYEATVYYFH